MMHAVKLVSGPKPPVLAGRYVHDNAYWRGAAARISVCVPTYRHDASELINALGASASAGLIEVLIYDDGSCDADILARMMNQAGRVAMAVRIVAAAVNHGRAAARNAALREARGDWILLLDADMLPDGSDFIEKYLDAIDTAGGPAVIAGGYSLKHAAQDGAFALHRWQAEASECVAADVRNLAPGRYVFSSNVLAHRAVLEACPFDEMFAGWGWEDTDWGLRVQRQFSIRHIDNTATHLGLDTDAALMGKYARSGANFALMTGRHPDAAAQMPLYRMAQRFRRLPFRGGLTAMAGAAARARLLPLPVRGRALKVWRALVYAGALS